MSYILAASLALSLSCNKSERELSQILHTDAIVENREYTAPVMHEIHLAKYEFGEHTYQKQTVKVREKNIIEFKSDRLKFWVDNKEIYNRFKIGDKADVTYKENYKLIYEDLDDDGIKESIDKYILNYEFIDAQPRMK